MAITVSALRHIAESPVRRPMGAHDGASQRAKLRAVYLDSAKYNSQQAQLRFQWYMDAKSPSLRIMYLDMMQGWTQAYDVAMVKADSYL